MAWDFSTDPEFEEQLEWMRAFVREEVWPIETIEERDRRRPSSTASTRRCRSRSRSAASGPRTCRRSSAARASARSSSG